MIEGELFAPWTHSFILFIRRQGVNERSQPYKVLLGEGVLVRLPGRRGKRNCICALAAPKFRYSGKVFFLIFSSHDRIYHRIRTPFKFDAPHRLFEGFSTTSCAIRKLTFTPPDNERHMKRTICASLFFPHAKD